MMQKLAKHLHKELQENKYILGLWKNSSFSGITVTYLNYDCSNINILEHHFIPVPHQPEEFLCHVRILDIEEKVAEPYGYTAPAVDVFAAAVSILIMFFASPPWKQVMIKIHQRLMIYYWIC